MLRCSGKEIIVFLTMVQSQQPALCASSPILSKQEGKVLSRHHYLRRTSSELFCLIFGISLSLVSVYLSMLSLCHSSWGPWVALNPLVWHSLWHGVSPSPWSVGATVFFQKTFPLCPLAASSSSFQAQSKWWAFLDEGFFSFPDVFIAPGPGWTRHPCLSSCYIMISSRTCGSKRSSSSDNSSII